jgi:PII-like signaling protein
MTIKPLLIVVVAAVPLLAQIPPDPNAFVQSAWIRMTDPGKSTQAPIRIDGQSGPVVGKPLSASEVRHSEQILFDGSHINNNETEHFYRDALGRMRTETATGAVVFDPVAGFTYDLTTSRKTYTKSPVSPAAVYTIAAAAHRSSIRSQIVQGKEKSENAPVVEDLPAQMLNGVYVKGTRVTITIPAGSIGNDHDLKVINERWFSDDLELLVKSSNTDPRFGISTYELTNIVQAPPQPALFEIPAGYTEGH